MEKIISQNLFYVKRNQGFFTFRERKKRTRWPLHRDGIFEAFVDTQSHRAVKNRWGDE